MNYKILTKCLEELNKEKPEIQYLKGMVETLLAMQPGPNPLVTPVIAAPLPPPIPVNLNVSDEIPPLQMPRMNFNNLN